MSVKTIVVAAGAAVVLGGIGVGVAQASSPGSTVAPSSTSTSSSTSSSTSHESEARGRVAEGETHARHTGTDDRTHSTAGPTSIPSPSPTVDDHGSGGHGADG